MRCSHYFTVIWRAVAAAVTRADPPGYRQLPWFERTRLNVRSLTAFARSVECLHMLAAKAVWSLLAHICVYRLDLPGSVLVQLHLLALVWLLPWAATARRRHLERLLGARWRA